MQRRLPQQLMTLSDFERPFHASRAISEVAELFVYFSMRPKFVYGRFGVEEFPGVIMNSIRERKTSCLHPPPAWLRLLGSNTHVLVYWGIHALKLSTNVAWLRVWSTQLHGYSIPTIPDSSSTCCKFCLSTLIILSRT